MSSKKKRLVAFTFSFMPIAVFAQLDITNRIIAETGLDDAIKEFCSAYCFGNTRIGKLDQLSATKLDADIYNIEAHASLENKDVMLGGYIPVPDFTVRVSASGMISTSDCVVSVSTIDVQGDPTGLLSSLASSQVGTKHSVEHCAHLLREL